MHLVFRERQISLGTEQGPVLAYIVGEEDEANVAFTPAGGDRFQSHERDIAMVFAVAV